MRSLVLRGVSRRFHRLSPCDGQVAHALRTLPPVAANVLLHRAAPRLACVKPAASVHPEPGSNSSLYISYFSQLDPDDSFPIRNRRSRSFCFGTCFLVLSFSLFNDLFCTRGLPARFSSPSFFRGCKGRNLFSFLQIFFENFFSSLPRAFRQSLSGHTLVSNGIAKVLIFSFFPNFYATFFAFRTGELRPNPTVYHFKLHGVRKLRN